MCIPTLCVPKVGRVAQAEEGSWAARAVRILGTPLQLRWTGLRSWWPEPTGPQPKAVFWLLLPSALLGPALLESVRWQNSPRKDDGTSGHGSGVGLTSDPDPESCPSEGLLSFTPAPVVFFSLGASVKGGYHRAEQKASVWAQGRLQAYCRIWPPSPTWGRSPLRCGKGM